MATTGIVNILHTFARTKHGTCTPASSFWVILRVCFFEFGKLILMLHVNSTSAYNVCPGEESGGRFAQLPWRSCGKDFHWGCPSPGDASGPNSEALPKGMPSSSFRRVSSCTPQQAGAYSPETQGKITYRMQLKLIMNTVINKVLIRTQKPFSHSNSCQLLWGW